MLFNPSGPDVSLALWFRPRGPPSSFSFTGRRVVLSFDELCAFLHGLEETLFFTQELHPQAMGTLKSVIEELKGCSYEEIEEAVNSYDFEEKFAKAAKDFAAGTGLPAHELLDEMYGRRHIIRAFLKIRQV